MTKRLGKFQRILILEACEGAALIALGSLPVADQRRRHRAAAALVRRGLAVVVSLGAENAAGAWRQMRHLELTSAGHDVCRAFRRELEDCREIRWNKLGERLELRFL